MKLLEVSSCLLALLVVRFSIFGAMERELKALFQEPPVQLVQVYVPPHVMHDLNPQQPDWNKLSQLRVQTNATTHQYRTFFLNRETTFHPPAWKPLWKPPTQRPVFAEWKESFRVDPSPQARELRFPSVEQRVRLYMSNWYHPPCNDAHVYESRPNASWVVQEQSTQETNKTTRFLEVNSTVLMDTIFALDKASIMNCSTNASSVLRDYCRDVQATAAPYLDDPVKVPFLWHFGDGKESNNYGESNLPHFRKIRSVAEDFSFLNDTAVCHASPRRALATHHGSDCLQPILWKLHTRRHFGKLHEVMREDIPWNEKAPRAVFRGVLSGRNRHGYSPEQTHEENCRRIPRCRLVLETHKSEIVDAKLSSTLGFLPHKVQDVPLIEEGNRKMSILSQLSYKGIIMLEGNDVSSGLKWALLSNSVVLMPIPTYSSWAMEEWLEPWVHYVPLKKDLTNVEQQMKWVNEHDDEAQAISRRATLWMNDLVLHERSAEEEGLIRQEILWRYQKHWSSSLPFVNKNPTTSLAKAAFGRNRTD